MHKDFVEGAGRAPLPRGVIAAAVFVLCGVAPLAHAADDKAVQAQLQRLADRLQQLEQRNGELERQVKDLKAAASAASAPAANTWGAERIEKVERANAALSERVEGLEHAEAPEPKAEEEGPKFETSFLAVAQSVNGRGAPDGKRQTRLNYRGDLTVELPGGAIGEATGKAFGHLRVGQGTGVSTIGTYSSTVNSVGFQTAAGPDDSYAILAQAWYQLDWALGTGGGFNEKPGDRVELTLGKMDLFGFFDQNAVAGDEGTQFLNNAFVHNPLLDSGGDIAADAYGMAPGARLSYINVGDGDWNWGASLGVFASGAGANFQSGARSPFAIAQFDLSPMQINGEPRGNYRVYAWTNGRTEGLDGQAERHSGIGLSVDQKLGGEWNVFGRLGKRFSGHGSFDRALTLGFEHGGRAWGRGSDAIGLAVGALHTDSRYGGISAASGNERLAEFYYRMKLNEHIELSPDLQIVKRAGGVASAPSVAVFGVRASVGF